MNGDPILHHLGIVLRRSLLFVVLSGAQAFAFWQWFWTQLKPWTFQQAAWHLTQAWPLSLDAVASVVAIAVVWIGVADTAVLYLLLGGWWKRRADVLYRRGSHLSDEREGN